MANTAPAKKNSRALWLSGPFIWLAASVACAQASSLCGEEDDELLTPSAWCTIERSSYLLAERSELVTPSAWSTLLDPFADSVPESELVTPDDWAR